MGFKIPNPIEVEVLTALVTPALTLRLYGNNFTPVDGDLASNYTEIAGGGYVNKALTFANWSIVGGTPSYATYAPQTWIFTGAVNAPGTIYGYYVTRNSDGHLILAERFPSAVVPFTTVNGSKIVVLPKITAESQF